MRHTLYPDVSCRIILVPMYLKFILSSHEAILCTLHKIIKNSSFYMWSVYLHNSYLNSSVIYWCFFTPIVKYNESFNEELCFIMVLIPDLPPYMIRPWLAEFKVSVQKIIRTLRWIHLTGRFAFAFNSHFRTIVCGKTVPSPSGKSSRLQAPLNYKIPIVSTILW